MSPTDPRASTSDEFSSDEEKPVISPPYSPSPPPPAKGKRKAPAKSGSSSTKKAKGAQANGSWSPEIRATIMKYIFDRGMDGLNYAELSAIVRNSAVTPNTSLTPDRTFLESAPQCSPEGQERQLPRKGDKGS